MRFEQADAFNETIRAIGNRHRELVVGALAPLGIHPGHKQLLAELAHGERTQAQLAAASGFEPPTVTLSLRQLESAGLVSRRPSSTDRRSTLVELTPSGRELIPKMRMAWRQAAETIAAELPPGHLDQLMVSLEVLRAALDAASADD